MINRIMTPRAAALAIAAPLLFSAPALADHGKSTRSSATVSIQNGQAGLTLHVGDRGRYGYTTNYDRNYRGYHHDNSYRLKEAKRRAIRSCRRAVRDQAHYAGFREVDFDSRGRAYQIGPRGFEVTFREVEFEGRRRDFERRVSCIVRRGEVRQIDGIPQPRRRGHHKRHGYYK